MRVISKNTGLPGDFIIRDQSWFHRRVTGQGDTEFRIIPEFINGVEQPQLKQPYTAEEDLRMLLTDSMAMYEIIKFAGEKKYSLITDITDPIEGAANLMRMFYDAISTHVKKNRKTAPDEWFDWLEGGYKAALRKPIACLFAKSVILKVGGKMQVDRNGNPCPTFPGIISITQSSAIQGILDGMTSLVNPNGPVAAENTPFGDVISCQKGKILGITTKEEYSPQLKKEQTVYTVTVLDPYPLPEKLVAKSCKPINEILNLQDSAWVLARLAETYSPEAVAFAFKDSPYGEKLPESAKKASAPRNANVVSFSTPELQYDDKVCGRPGGVATPAVPFEEEDVAQIPMPPRKTISTAPTAEPSTQAGDFPDPKKAMEELMTIQKKLRRGRIE